MFLDSKINENLYTQAQEFDSTIIDSWNELNKSLNLNLLFF